MSMQRQLTLTEQIAELSAKQPSAWLGMSLECPEDVAVPLYTSAPSEPAPASEAATIEACFWSALADGREVLLLAGMPDPSHASTNDPILDKSPLARLAFAFLELAGPRTFDLAERITFDPTRLNNRVTNVVTIGEVGLVDVVRSIALPRMSFSHCMLNDVLFADWVGWHSNQLIARTAEHERDLSTDVRYDATRLEHCVIAECLAEHFDANGWSGAAERVRAQLESTCH